MLIPLHMKEDGEMRVFNTDFISEIHRIDRQEPAEGSRVYTMGGPEATCNVSEVMETPEQIMAMEQVQQIARKAVRQ